MTARDLALCGGTLTRPIRRAWRWHRDRWPVRAMRPLMLCIALASPLAASAALAQDAPEPAPDDEAHEEEARTVFAAGEVAYQRGHYERALAYFRQAYALSPRPVLLYNIGLAADRARRDDEAIEAFESFLEAVPDHPQRGFVETRLADLRRGDEGGGVEPGAVILVVTGGVLLAGGAASLVLGLLDAQSVLDAPQGARWADYREPYDRIELLEGLGIAGLATGALALAVGIAWLMAAPRAGERARLERALRWSF